MSTVNRKAYPSDVSDDEGALVAPYLTLLPEDAGQRRYPLREVFNALRWLVRAGAPWRLMPNDLPPWEMVYQQTQRWLVAVVTAADEQERDQVGYWAGRVQQVTGESVELAYVDQGYTGDEPAAAAAAHGIRLEVVKLPEAKQGFVLLPRRWVVERSFGWLARFRRLARDYERLAETVEGLTFVAFACLMLHRLIHILGS